MIPNLKDIDEIERRYRERGGPILGEAFARLKERWDAGARDTETALRLLFLCWYGIVEPPGNTGLTGDAAAQEAFGRVFAEAGGLDADPEILFAVGHMASLFPFNLGDERKWAALGKKALECARAKNPAGCRPEHFEGRGEYGAYFAHQVRGGGFA